MAVRLRTLRLRPLRMRLERLRRLRRLWWLWWLRPLRLRPMRLRLARLRGLWRLRRLLLVLGPLPPLLKGRTQSGFVGQHNLLGRVLLDPTEIFLLSPGQRRFIAEH